MTKRQLRKTARIRIISEGQSHQQVYEALKDEPGFTRDEIALELCKFPSEAKRAQNRGLVGIFIGILAIIVVLRLLGTFVISESLKMNGPILLLVILIGVIAPVMGIVGAIQNRVEIYRAVGFLFVFSIFRSVKQLDTGDAMTLIGFVPFVIAIGLAFWIPERLKTPYKRSTVTETDASGKERQVTQISFEATSGVNGDLLDSGI
jgi:hypothetical protein